MTETHTPQDQSKTIGLAPRLAAARALKSVLQGASFSPLGVDQIADARDRALANKLVTTALRRQGHLNEILKKALKKGLPKKSGLFEAVMRIGLTELLFLPDQADHSALYLSVEVLRTDRRAGRFDSLLNGVLRQAQRDAAGWQQQDIKRLIPEDFRADWITRFGNDAVEKMAEALLAGAPLDLTLRAEDADLIAELGGRVIFADSVRIEERDRPVNKLAGYEDGKWWVQDAAAALPARLFTKSSGAKALDMCAAPGGKTAQLCKKGYAVTALDRSATRLERVAENLSRIGYEAKLVEADVLAFEADGQFDAILLDAPCSATGTFRRHPEVLWQRGAEDVHSRVKIQRQMLEKAVNLLAPGGELIYCVCSLEHAEGEAQADWVLHKFPHLMLAPITAQDGSALSSDNIVDGRLRTHPGQSLDGSATGGLDGFFVARFRRSE